MATIDDFFLAHGISFSGFNTFLTRNGNPSFTVGVAGFGNRNGVYGQTEVIDVPRFVAGVYGTAATQPGVIGFSRDGDGAQGASFAGTAFRAASFFGPGVHSTSGALSGVTGISNTQGPPVPMNIPTIAGVVGTAGARPGVIGTSDALMGVFGFSTGNAGVVGQTANPNSFAGFFAGNAVVTGTLTAAVKNAMVAFPDGSQRVLHCMESPEHWFEDFGTAKLKGGRTAVRLDPDFAKVITRDYRVFLTPRAIAAGSMCTKRVLRDSRCASSWAASRPLRSAIVSLAGAETSGDIGASPRSIRACSCPRAPRLASARRARQSYAHSLRGWRRKHASARPSARGKLEGRALSAGRRGRAGARRNNCAEPQQ